MLESIGFAVAYTGVGIALLTLGFFALDLLTPGRLGAHLTEAGFHPAALVSVAAQLAVAASIVASIWP